jgi:hypothetical protein
MYQKIKATILLQAYYLIIRMVNNMEYPNRFLNPQPRTSFLRMLPQHIVMGIITIKDKLNNPNIITLED